MNLGKSNLKGVPLEGDCCPSPFGYLRNGRLMIYGRHDRELHVLVLKPEDLRKIATELERSCDKIAPVA